VNDIEDLRDAMQSTPDFEPAPLDLAVVMAAGGRLRRRRRLAVGAASGLAVLALLVGGAQLARPEPPVNGTANGGAAAPASRDSGVLGDVIPTGLRIGSDERVLYVVPVDAPELPDVPFGVVNGRRLPDGRLVSDVLVNESEGPARAEGFHAAQQAMEVEGKTTLAYGYYAGDAAKIVVRADGKRVEASLAVWSDDPSIVVFWFDPAQVKPGVKLSGLTAYNRDGRVLPAGHATFGVG
jgi:hypothetical protein